MSDWMLLALPLLALPIVLLFRFVGCGSLLEIEGTVADFTIEVKPPAVNVMQSTTGSVDAEVKSVGGFVGTVTFAIVGTSDVGVTFAGTPSGAAPNSVSLTSGASATMKITLTVPGTVKPGALRINLNATSGTTVRPVTVDLFVLGFINIMLAPKTIDIGRLQTLPVVATIQSLGVTGSIQMGVDNAGADVNPTFGANPVPLLIPGAINVSVLTIAVGQNAAIGPRDLSVKGTQGAATAAVPLTLNVVEPDFSLELSPPSVTVQRPGTASFTVTIKRVGGYSASVSLSTQPPGGDFTPQLTTGTTSQLDAAIPAQTSPGLLTFSVHGIGSGDNRLRTVGGTVNVI